jgi:hypothetical protein
VSWDGASRGKAAPAGPKAAPAGTESGFIRRLWRGLGAQHDG